MYEPTGAIVAAPTTSLPEDTRRSARIRDYRYCWLRDATFTLLGFINSGVHMSEARKWKNWLVRVASGSARQIRVMYGVAGRATNYQNGSFPGSTGTKSLALFGFGNPYASKQFQLDIYGELADALLHADRAGIDGVRNDFNLVTEVS